MAFIKKGLTLVAQPIPYFLSKISELVDFDITVTTSKKDHTNPTKGSIGKVRIIAAKKNGKNTRILNEFIEATIQQYKGLTLTKGQIEVKIKDAKK